MFKKIFCKVNRKFKVTSDNTVEPLKYLRYTSSYATYNVRLFGEEEKFKDTFENYIEAIDVGNMTKNEFKQYVNSIR